MEDAETMVSSTAHDGETTSRRSESHASLTRLSARRFRSRSTWSASIVEDSNIIRTQAQEKDYRMVVLHPGRPLQTRGIIADFVLVHGLTGDYMDTWTVKPGWRKKGGYCWPNQLLPELYPNLRIMSFSYDADVTHMCGATRVAEGDVVEYADTFLTWLRTIRPDDSPESNRPLIFFGHSLGGLVIERALLIASREEADWLFKLYHATVAVYVFGTPHYGSAFASLIVPVAQAIRPFHFVNMHILKDLLPAKMRHGRHGGQETSGETSEKEKSTWQDEVIDLLRRRKADNDPIRFFCGFEQLGRAGIPGLHRVVPAHSAILSNDHSIVDQCGFHVTHTDLVRFKGQQDSGFQIFDARLRSLVLHLSTVEATISPTSQDEPWRVIWRTDVLPTMVKTFVGREKPLKEIFEALKAWSRNRPAVVVLIANGGYGKSQIALEYARRRFEDRTYDRVFWADASSEQAAKLSFVRIWDTIKPKTGGTTDEKFEKACGALRDMSVRWLLVIDNFDRSVLDTDELPETAVDERHGTPDSETDIRNTYIKNFLPQNDFGHVIITSRDKRVRHLGEPVKVPLMTNDEGILMLKTRLSAKLDPAIVQWDDDEAKKIIEEVDCLPLAIEQVASYIISSRSSLKKFLDTYQHARRDIFERVPEESNFRVSRVREGSSYVKKSLGVLEVWEMSLKTIEQHRNKRIRDIALAMLAASGFLDRTDISIKFLTKLQVASRGMTHWTTLGRDDITLLELDKAAQLLDSWSVIQGIQREEDQDQVEKLTVHPLIQDWIRLRMTPSNLYDEALKTIQLIERNLARDHDELLATSFESKHEIVRHISAIRSLLETERPEFETLKRIEFGKGILSEATITIASFFYDLGDLNTATQLFELVMSSHRGRGGGEEGDDPQTGTTPDPLFLQAEEGLALVRLWKEDGDGAFELLNHAVKGYQQLAKPHYNRPLHRAIHNLGEVECFRKHCPAAISLFQTSLAGFTAEFGRGSKEVYREKEALGNAYRASGRLHEAHEQVSEAYEGLVRLDPKGDATVNATESLALVLKARGEFPRAEELYHSVIGAYERSVGRNQYTTLGAVGGLADVYRKSGEWEKAAVEYARIMRRMEESRSTGEAQYVRARAAYENVTSGRPDGGMVDDFSYPWPRAVGELQTRPLQGSR